MSPPRRHPALDAWGEYDRDDPFPLFAQVRVAGPVHEARLADGHAAWLVVGHEEARAALADPRSRRTCTRRRRAARRSSRTAFPGLRWPATCWSSTHPTTPGCGGWPRPPSASGGSPRSEDQGPVGRRPPARRPAARGGANRPVDLVAGYAFPAAVHGDQRAARIPEPDRADLGPLGSGSCPAIWSTTHRPSRCWSSRSTPTCASSSTAGGTRHRSDGHGQSWLRPTSPHPASPSTRGPGLDRRLRDQTQPHDRT